MTLQEWVGYFMTEMADQQVQENNGKVVKEVKERKKIDGYLQKTLIALATFTSTLEINFPAALQNTIDQYCQHQREKCAALVPSKYREAVLNAEQPTLIEV
jgi:hypothetical protein